MNYIDPSCSAGPARTWLDYLGITGFGSVRDATRPRGCCVEVERWRDGFVPMLIGVGCK